MARYALVLALLLAALLSCSQSTDQAGSAAGETAPEPEASGRMVRLVTDPDVAEDEARPIEPVDAPTASIVYLANEVTVHGAAGSMPAEIAMELVAGDRITVGPESSCEIHVGDYARLMLEENTTVTVRDVALTAGGGSTRIAQRSGTLLSKVNRLAGNDRFVVATPSLVAGVRGTEFATTVADDGAVAVAVADGVVAVRDYVPEIDSAVPETEEEREAVAALAGALESAAVAVEAGRQVSAAPQESAPPALPAELAANLEVRSLALDPEALAAVVAQVDSFVARAAEATPTRAPQAASDEQLSRLRKLDVLAPVRLTRPERDDADEPELVALTVRTDPPGALVSFEPRPAAPAPVSGLFARGSEIEIRVSAPAYRERVIRITLTEERGRSLVVPLEPAEEPAAEEPAEQAAAETVVEPQSPGASEPAAAPQPAAEAAKPAAEAAQPPAAPAEERVAVAPRTAPTAAPPVAEAPEPEPEPEPATRRVAVRVAPADARVVIEGGVSFTGAREVDLVEGERYTIRVTRANYESQARTVAVTASAPGVLEFRLEPVDILWSRSVATAPLVRELVADGADIAWAAADGSVGVVGPDGRERWSLATSNRPNENSRPVLDGRTLYFSGASEFVTVDRRSGSVIDRSPISGADAHIFGRSVTPVAGGYAYPTNTGLRVVTGGRAVELPVPEGTTMSAALIGDLLVVGGNTGTLVGYRIGGGDPVFSIDTGVVQPVAHAPAGYGDLVYIVGRRGRLVAADTRRGTVAWSVTLPAGTFSDPVVSAEGVFVFAAGAVHAYDHAGKPLFPPVASSSPPVVAGGRLFHGDANGSLVERGARDGAFVASLAVGSPITAQPVVLSDRVIVGLSDGRIVAVHRAAMER